ncbi:MAG: acyltransferase family protein [Thermoguttaceae bacterium]
MGKVFDIDRVNFQFLIVGPTVGYFVAGYFLGNQRTHLKYALLFFASFILIASIITWIGFVSSAPYNMRFRLFGFLVIPLVLMLFYILKHVGNTTFYQQSGFSRFIAFFAPLTFGIYIVHILVMHFIGDGVCGVSLNISTFPPWVSIPLTVAAVFFMSALLVWTLKKVPFVRWILP